MYLISAQICKTLEFKKVTFIKLGTDSSQSRFKLVLKLIKKFGAACGYVISYLEKYIDYIEILRAPPKEAASHN